MQPSPLWVPYNQPPQRRFSLLAWIAGHAGIAIAAKWAGLLLFALATLIPFGADESFLNQLGMSGRSTCFIFGFAWLQRGALTSKGLKLPHWMTASILYSLVAFIWWLGVDYGSPSNPIYSGLYYGFWAGLGLTHGIVLWQTSTKLGAYWVLAGIGASLLGGAATLLVDRMIGPAVGGIIYVVATGMIVQAYRSPDSTMLG